MNTQMKRILFFLLGLLLISNILFSQAGVGPAPYCMPVYNNQPCNQGGLSNAPGNFINDFINSFNTTGATNNITNNNSGCNAQTFPNIGVRNYFFHGCQHYLVVSPGQVITCNFQSGNVYAQGFAVFIDWNNNGVFNLPGERVIGTPVPPAATFISANFTVPAAQPVGAYRMRVRCAYATTGTFIDPCNIHGYGETEDYMIYVGMNPPGIITATLSSNSPVCTGNNLNLTTVASGTNPSTYTYTWSGPNSFTSNVQSPTIAATNPNQSGVYTVTINPGGCPITKTISLVVNATPTITSVSNNGPVCQGSSVGITLSNSTSGTTSYLWTGPNSFTSNAQSPLIAISNPTNSGVYTVTVTNTFTNNATCTSTTSTSFVVVPVNTIAVTPSFTLCQGSNLALTAGVTGASSFVWTGPNSFSSTVQNPLINNTTPNNSGNYNVTAYFSAPNTTLICNSTAVINVSIVPIAPVTPFATNNVCQNGTATFSAIANGAAGYSWTGPNGFASQNQVNQINNIQPISSGNYAVNAIFSIGTVSCITSNMIGINVVPVSTISLVPNVSVCEGNNVQFSANAPGALSYTWTGPNNFNVSNPTIQFVNSTPNFSGIYTVNASFSNGSLICYNTATTNLLVKPLLNFSLSPIDPICFGSNLLVNGPLGATSYSWVGPGFSSNSQNLQISNTSTINAGMYYLTVDLNGCKTFGSIKVMVNNPIVWKQVPLDKTLCKGETFTFTAQADQGSGNYAYTWNPTYGITGPTGSIQPGQAIGTTVYNVSVYDIACPNYTINHSVVLTVNQPPVPNLNLTKNNLCEPVCQILNSKLSQEASSVIYEFNPDKIFYGDSIKVCLNAGIYDIKIHTQGKNGCKGVFDFGTQLKIYPQPQPDFSFIPEEPNNISNSKVTFYPTVKHGKNVLYTWYFQNPKEIETSEKNPVISYEESGKFPVYLIATNEWNCTDTVSKSIKIEDDITIYIPNVFSPNDDKMNDVFNVKGNGLSSENYYMEIFDRWGELLYATNDINKGWDGTVKGVKVADGVYIYSVRVSFTNNRGKKEFKGHITVLK